MAVTVAAIIGAAAAAASTGYALSGAGNPTAPNLGQSSRELANMQAQLLPMQRALEAAAQQGRSVTIDIPEHSEKTQSVWLADPAQTMTLAGRNYTVPSTSGHFIPYKAEEWAAGGKYNPDGSTAAPHVTTKDIKIPAGPQTFDFTGYGSADVQGQLAKAMAKVQLALGQKYNSQFINQALEQEQLADPQSFAARQRMNDLIQEQIGRPLNVPVADELSRQVQEELAAAGQGRLDPRMHDILLSAGDQALSSRGGGGPAVNFEEPLTTGAAGTARKLAAIGKATGELASGQTPEDIAYRREQQDLANLSSFVAGKTPQSQFSSLSGAQRGPAPFVPGQPLPTMPSSSGAPASALQSWQTQQTVAGSQTPDWMAGLNALLGLGKTAAGLGWQPLKN